MKKQYDQVAGFHKACGIEMPKAPEMLSKAQSSDHMGAGIASMSKRMKEYSAFAKACGIDSRLEVIDRTSYMLEELAEFAQANTIEDQADALIDLIYFAIGTFTLMGINPEPLFDIVARANLGKIMPDGTVLRDDQGKIVKPPGWAEQYAPEKLLKLEIEHQGMRAAIHLHNDVCCEKAYVENVQVCKQCQEDSELLMQVNPEFGPDWLFD